MRHKVNIDCSKTVFSAVCESLWSASASFFGLSKDGPRDIFSVGEAEVFLGLYVGFGAVCCGVSALIFAHSTQRVSPEGCDAAENAKFSVFSP